ncbi:MAG TPA: hypothetical protein VLT47_13115 [Anaeromyxobacteraceae bacterium]|nr:hypothetical protein [Anaeromyxobacteraceae bacterium]
MDEAAKPSRAPLHTERRPDTPEIVRQIVLARFLERPPDAVALAVERAEAIVWRHRLLAGRVPAIQRVPAPGVAAGEVPPGACGVVEPRDGAPVLVLPTRCAARYEIDRARLAAWLDRTDAGTRIRVLRAVRTLHLATARSSITGAVWTVLAKVQRRYLASCDAAELVPLTAREVVRRARAAGADLVDAGRVSRTLRATAVVFPDGSTHPLAILCPSTRAVTAARLSKLLERERELRAVGRLRRAWNDAELARRLGRIHGAPVSPRIVCYCRKRLAVPGARERARSPAYMSATTGFSALRPLDRRSVIRRAPRAPGVYELRIAPGQPLYEPTCSGIVYVGRARDLRARLLVHAGASARNERLVSLVRGSRVLFRFRVESGELRPIEAELYRRFCDTYGHHPSCNRVSP